MAGIYLHIPYCKQKCHYCNFYSFASSQYRENFVTTLINELEQRKAYLEEATIGTIYLGGGTPSMLTHDEINRILKSIFSSFKVKPDAEITLEANPDDLDKNYLRTLKNETAVNRLSIGVQSFFSEDLHYLNRVHDGKQARQSIDHALETGFNNLTIDLIYGIPTLTLDNWNKNLSIFFDYDLPHLSSYSLTIEPKTALNTLINKGQIQGVKEEQSIEHFNLLLERTLQQGYVHYEISNFAKEGFYSKHNSIYWLGGHYLGAGPSAHSFNGKTRQWNVSNMKDYMQSDKVDQIVEETEILTVEQQYNEYVMTSLRTSWGCDKEHISNVFGRERAAIFETGIGPFVKEGKVNKKGSLYVLTNEGKLFADGIAASLFLDSQG